MPIVDDGKCSLAAVEKALCRERTRSACWEFRGCC